MIQATHILIGTASALILATLFSLSSYIVAAKPFIWRKFLISFALYLFTALFSVFILSTDSPFKMLTITMCILLSNWLAYGFTGYQLLFYTFIILLTSFSGDILSGVMMIQLADSQTIAAMRDATSPLSLVMQFGSGSAMILFASVYRLIATLIKRRRSHSSIGYLLRPIFLLIIICVIFAQALLRMSTSDQHQRFLQALPDFIIIALLIGIGITYIVQDIRYYTQAKENRQLMHQQSLQSLLLQDTRVFRHNISNMLYGLQGTLLSGDIAAIESYYRGMVEACQLINNENVIALKRLPSQAVSTLLLNKIQQSNALNIPFYVAVAEDIAWHGMRDEDMTQVLGILVDNAIEAAQESIAPYVSVEARNVSGALSIIVRNSHKPGELPPLTLDAPSTKPGHEGLGLGSVQRILRRYPKVLFNLYPCGRYVEANLVCY